MAILKQHYEDQLSVIAGNLEDAKQALLNWASNKADLQSNNPNYDYTALLASVETAEDNFVSAVNTLIQT